MRTRPANHQRRNRLISWGVSSVIEDAMTDPLTRGKIRSGRDDGRPTEDDIARQRVGQQGVPGVAKPQVMDDDKLQNPKPIDPGHVA
jgi:hypothetical protein